MSWMLINGMPIRMGSSKIIVTADSEVITADNDDITVDQDDE